jgi:hypothetical protein
MSLTVGIAHPRPTGSSRGACAASYARQRSTPGGRCRSLHRAPRPGCAGSACRMPSPRLHRGRDTRWHWQSFGPARPASALRHGRSRIRRRFHRPHRPRHRSMGSRQPVQRACSPCHQWKWQPRDAPARPGRQTRRCQRNPPSVDRDQPQAPSRVRTRSHSSCRSTVIRRLSGTVGIPQAAANRWAPCPTSSTASPASSTLRPSGSDSRCDARPRQRPRPGSASIRPASISTPSCVVPNHGRH